MSKALHRLTVKQLDATAPGTALSDGGGLLYRSTSKGQGKWTFKFTSPDVDFRVGQVAKGSASFQRSMGPGAYPAVGPAAARAGASAARDLVARGIDPIEAERRADEEARQRGEEIARATAQQAMTFGRYADERFLPYVLPGYSNKAHIQQWQATFNTHAASLRPKPLADITREDVLAVLKPIWTTKHVTAKRSRERIERLFSHAIQNGHYKGDNPASWRQCDATPPAPRYQPKHHPAVPQESMAAFMVALRVKQPVSMSALLLEWIALSACRTGEARKAVWSEIDAATGLWTVPAGRTKTRRRDHIVSITRRMAEILVEAKRRRPADEPDNDFIFVGEKGKPLSEMAAVMLMRGMKDFSVYVPHGFRATFKGWAATGTAYPRELIEEQLAHQLGAVERAYMRESAHQRRRPMMEAWADFCDGKSADVDASNVVPLASGRGR